MTTPGPADASNAVCRVRLRVRGVVQGVGFRPFVHRLATRLQLVGSVWNDGEGVVIVAQGAPAEVARFAAALSLEAPPMARVAAVESTPLPAGAETDFRIGPSLEGPTATMIAPDAATCADCLRELFDPADRRYRYPFINCTNCGPRFSIIRSIPYDRSRTTMGGFAMCRACRSEYEDPADRRFHAQPNACPECGPTAALITVRGAGQPAGGVGPVSAADSTDAISRAAAALREGALLAVKGLGGYHFACRADRESVVSRLRGAKIREDKPFAVMVADLSAARRLVALDDEEARCLAGSEAPILLAARLPGTAIAAAVAPGRAELGVMLAYTPLHHLLLADLGGTPLVMTSGNRSDEPIAFGDDDARERLGPMVDWLLTHDRPIRTRVEDSVVRVVSVGGIRHPMLLRRSRGFVPGPVALPAGLAQPVLGCGAERKTTFTLGAGTIAWPGPHIGDLREFEALRSYRDGVEHLTRLLELEPALGVHDAHPDYLSTKEAQVRHERLFAVQHHHAHLAACLAEHGVTGPAVGAIYDGAGLGPDGTIWGGELLIGDLASFDRAGHLWPVSQPGGDAAARQPWRMACAWLAEVKGAVPNLPPRLEGLVDPAAWRAVARMAIQRLHAPTTTSVGRLFDAVAAIAGVRAEVTHEGQAAAELEAAAACAVGNGVDRAAGDTDDHGGQPGYGDGERRSGDAAEDARRGYPLSVVDRTSVTLLDARPTISAVARDAAEGIPVGTISARFHAALAGGTAAACKSLADRHGLSTVVLSGGVFQNARLLEATAAALTADGLRVLVPRRIPPNDGGIAYGQVAVVAGVAGWRSEVPGERDTRVEGA